MSEVRALGRIPAPALIPWTLARHAHRASTDSPTTRAFSISAQTLAQTTTSTPAHHKARARGHENTFGPSADIVGGSELFVRSTSAPHETPQTCLQTRTPSRHFGRGALTGDLRASGRTTSSPVHGCLPPPSKGGSKGPGRGRTPPQHTILRPEPATAETSVPLTVQHLHLRLPVLNREYFHPQTV